jgi:putative flippase GtrA
MVDIMSPQTRPRSQASAGSRSSPCRLTRAGTAAVLAGQLGRYTAIGVACTLAYLALFELLQGVLGAQPANLLAWLVTAVADTACNRSLTFGVSGRAGAVRAQLVVFGIGLGMTTGSLAGLGAITSQPGHALELAVIVAANLGAGVLRFVLLHSWVFAPRRRVLAARAT